MVGLIGEGQEIHLGEEAGLIQWNAAVANMPNQWIVNCPERIQSTFPNAAEVRSYQELDLNISLRTHLAEDVQSWVKNLLMADIEKAAAISKRIRDQGFNMYITQNLDVAKNYVLDRYYGELDIP